MRKYVSTSWNLRRDLVRMWTAGATPVDMIRFLHSRNHAGSRVGNALGEAFGVPSLEQRYANNWRADGTGVADDVANEVLTRAIHDAAAEAALAGVTPTDYEAVESPQRRAAMHVLPAMWDGTAVEIVRFLRCCGIEGDLMDEVFRMVFGPRRLYDRFAGGWPKDGDGPLDHVLSDRVSQALAEAEREVVDGSGESTSHGWIDLAGRGPAPIDRAHASRVLAAMSEAGVAATTMIDLLRARGLEPDQAADAFAATFGLGAVERDVAAAWLMSSGGLTKGRVDERLRVAIDTARAP